MPDSKDSSPDFIRKQLDQVRRQCAMIVRGDYKGAILVGNRLNLALSGLPRLPALTGDQTEPNSSGKDLRELLNEMKQLQSQALDRLIASRDRLARVLQDMKKGRQLLHGYRSGKNTKHRLFDISG